MKRNRGIMILVAGILSCAFPLLWSSLQLSALTVEVGWLLLGCLIFLEIPLQLLEVPLAAVILTPGLFVTLATHTDLTTGLAYVSVIRVMLTLGTYAALAGLTELSNNPALRLTLRIFLLIVVLLLFALALERSSLLLPLSLAALSMAVLMFLRSARSRAR
jgi:hypothetical protein